MEVERGGKTVATVKKALITPLRDRFSIEVEDGEEMEAKGNIVDHEYKIERGGDKVAEVSRRWFRMRDTYGIEIAEGQDDALILAVTVCIDQSHTRRPGRNAAKLRGRGRRSVQRGLSLWAGRAAAAVAL
jgi:uncharacterized protein YxjI